MTWNKYDSEQRKRVFEAIRDLAARTDEPWLQGALYDAASELENPAWTDDAEPRQGVGVRW